MKLNGASGMSDIEGKATRVGASERGQRTSFNYFPDTDSLYIDLSHKQSTESQALAAPSARPPPPKYSVTFSAVVDSRSEHRPVALPVSGRVSEANEQRLALRPCTQALTGH